MAINKQILSRKSTKSTKQRSIAARRSSQSVNCPPPSTELPKNLKPVIPADDFESVRNNRAGIRSSAFKAEYED